MICNQIYKRVSKVLVCIRNKGLKVTRFFGKFDKFDKS